VIVVIEALQDFLGEWQLEVDLPGAEDLRGLVVFEEVGELLVQRTSVPVPEAPDSVCVVVNTDGYVQHYFDARGTARIYAMTFDGTTWTLERTQADFSPLDFCQRYIGTFSNSRDTIDGEWQSSKDGHEWRRDFALTYRRVATAS
jgi:hypothetical protein